MLGDTPREPRKTVKISAQMRVNTSSQRVMICNVSSRGMMLRSSRPPPQGSYVELIRPGVATVARVMWSGERSFGVQTREKLDVAAMTRQEAGTSLALDKTVTSAAFVPSDRGKSYIGELHSAASSNWLAGGIQFVVIAAVGLAVTVFASVLIFDLLFGMSQAVASRLG